MTVTLQDPRSLNDKLTLLFELRQDRHIRNHFLQSKVANNRINMIHASRKPNH